MVTRDYVSQERQNIWIRNHAHDAKTICRRLQLHAARANSITALEASADFHKEKQTFHLAADLYSVIKW